MPGPAPDKRDDLLGAFAKALFKKDLDALYQVVTPDFVWSLPIGPTGPHGRRLASRDDLAAYFEERDRLYASIRFQDVVYHHAPEVTLMTFRVRCVVRATNVAFDVQGMEQYVFRDDRIALKDAYWKQIADEQVLAARMADASAA